MEPVRYDPARSLAPLVERLSPAVVNLAVETGPNSKDQEMEEYYRRFFGQERGPNLPRREGQGSGFLISADGYILTNHHVIADAKQITVRLADEQEFTGTVVGTDPRIDVGLVKIESPTPLPFVSLGSSDSLRVGDWVVAIGNPFGLSHTVTQGIVSAKGRSIGAGPYDDFIQTDASINPGNSGGPLFDLSGNVIGINTAITAMGQGIGFAVPSDMAADVIDDLKRSGKVTRGWMGVGLSEKNGTVVLSEIYPNTPAYRAGIQNGDVVERVNGVAVADASELVRQVGNMRPGEVVRLRILRDGQPKLIRVTLTERPDESRLRSYGRP